jgi:hypothetical protein
MKRRPTHRERPRTLRADQRGAFMVMGIFVSLILVGALWSIAGTGEAIIFHERAQEMADSGTLAAASMDAHGMNFIVLYNLVFAAGDAVLVVMSAILALVPAVPGAPALNSQFALPSGTLSNMFGQLMEAELGMQIQTPSIAGLNSTGLSYSPSIPWVVYTSTQSEGNAASMSSLQYYLPLVRVQPALCAAAFRAANPPSPATPVMVEHLLDPSVLNDMADETNVRNLLAAAQLANDTAFCQLQLYGATGTTDDVAPGYSNGYPGAQIFTAVTTTDPTPTVATKLIEVAARNGVVMGNPTTNNQFAQSEFYYDCNGAWTDVACDGAGLAMWNFNWFDRLRLWNPAAAAQAPAAANALVGTPKSPANPAIANIIDAERAAEDELYTRAANDLGAAKSSTARAELQSALPVLHGATPSLTLH